MAKYKLTYFNIRARGETARMLFKLAGQDFKDNRIGFDEWPKLKSTLPMGQVPLLNVDGVEICQSNAINRFLANQFGFYGDTPVDKALIDMVIDCVEEATKTIPKIIGESNADRKAALALLYKKEILKPTLDNIEKILKRNNDGNGYFVGNKMTVADIHFTNIVTLCMNLCQENIWDSYPKLKALKERVENHPIIASWIKERPQTDI